MSLLLALLTAGGTNYSRTLLDSVVVSDSTLRFLLAQRAIADTASVFDGVMRGVLADRYVADALLVEDAVLRSSLLARAAREDVAIADSLFRQSLLARSVAEALAIDDALLRSARDYRSDGDSAVVGDALRVTITLGAAEGIVYTRTLADAVAVADAQSAELRGDKERLLADPVVVADSLLRTVTTQSVQSVSSGSRKGMFPNTLRHLRAVPDTRQVEEPRIHIQVALEAANSAEISLAKVPRSSMLAAPIEDDSDFEEAALMLLLAA